jgi:hypothetical protein
MQKIYFLNTILCFLLFIQNNIIVAQEKKIVPIEVNLEQLKSDEFPAIYLSCEVNIHFIGKYHVDSIYFPLHESFKVQHTIFNNYKINTGYACYDPDDTILRINIHTQFGWLIFENKFDAFPPVKIIAFDSLEKEIDLSSHKISYCGEIHFRGILDYPKYCWTWDRLRGHYHIDILDENKKTVILRTNGWYDIYDKTRPVNLNIVSELKKVYIHFDENHLKKFYYALAENIGSDICTTRDVYHLKLADYNKQDILVEFP